MREDMRTSSVGSDLGSAGDLPDEYVRYLRERRDHLEEATELRPLDVVLGSVVDRHGSTPRLSTVLLHGVVDGW